jgi:hypothetical protein
MDDFVLTAENYYSEEANKRYMSFPQYLSFVGGMVIQGCEAKAMAELNGEWQDEKTTPLMVGSYVDSYFEGTLDKFKEENPDIFTKQGELKASFRQAETMVKRCEQDDYFMATMSGEKQVIMTANWAGCDWKIKMDSYIPGAAIVDLKTLKAFRSISRRNSADVWVKDTGYEKFYHYWGYDLQLAVYQEIVRQNTGEKLPCYLAVITKEEEPDFGVGQLMQSELDAGLAEITEYRVDRIQKLKAGEIYPDMCGECDCCRANMVLEGPVWAADW